MSTSLNINELISKFELIFFYFKGIAARQPPVVIVGVKDVPREKPCSESSKVLPGIASLFKSGSRKELSEDNIYCFIEPPKLPPPTCESDKCRSGCRPAKNSDVDIYSDDSGDDSGDHESDCGTSFETSSHSSEEDTLDAFNEISAQEPRQSATSSSSAAKGKSKEENKSERQKGDAASLKQYAYGKRYSFLEFCDYRLDFCYSCIDFS